MHARSTASLLVLVVGLAACGADGADVAAPAPAEAAAPDPVPAAGPVIATRDTALGPVLTDADGLTLYGFTNDVDAVSTCYDVCAEAWPPLVTAGEVVAAPGVDTGVLATTPRDDGTTQLIAGRFPLYTFGADTVPGDVTGHGSGGVWFAVGVDGLLLDADATAGTDQPAADAPPVQVGETSLGDALVDAAGLTLYGFVPDREAGAPTCIEGCAQAWPPLVVATPELPSGLDPELFSVVEHPDGSLQLAAGVWPLYLFAGDAAPGETNGQGSGGDWFVVAPDGTLLGNE